MRWVILLSVLVLAAGCGESMDRQNRYSTYGVAQQSWPSQGEALTPPEGTVAVGELARDAALATPPRVDRALLARGRERYDIFCSVCHGLAGDGDGIVVARGFPKPPSFRDVRPMQAPPAHLIDVIGHGYGTMYGFADRIPPADRWAIVAYVRALQLAATQRSTPP